VNHLTSRFCSGTMALKADAVLKGLPDGTQVAVVTLLGSLCPITSSHVEGFHEARRILLAEEGVKRPDQLEVFGAVLGYISLNGDRYVGSKMQSNGQPLLDYSKRRELVRLATSDDDWIEDEQHEGFTVGRVLPERYPTLSFTHFCMNGADDVVKYGKWAYASKANRFITMGRAGYTEQVLEGMSRSGVDPSHFLLGPELPDCSSTAVRHALACRDAASLELLSSLLHPKVKEWLLDNGPYKPSA